MLQIIKLIFHLKLVTYFPPRSNIFMLIIKKYTKGLSQGDFHEEPLGYDFFYPDW